MTHKGVKVRLVQGRGEAYETHIDKRGSTGITKAPPEKPRTDFVVRTVNGRKTKLFVYRCKTCRSYYWHRRENSLQTQG